MKALLKKKRQYNRNEVQIDVVNSGWEKVDTRAPQGTVLDVRLLESGLLKQTK